MEVLIFQQSSPVKEAFSYWRNGNLIFFCCSHHHLLSVACSKAARASNRQPAVRECTGHVGDRREADCRSDDGHPESFRITGMMKWPVWELNKALEPEQQVWAAHSWRLAHEFSPRPDQFLWFASLPSSQGPRACWRVMRSRCRARAEGGTGGSRSARWRGTGGSSPQQTGTGSGGWGVGGKGQSLSSDPCSTCCVCRGCCGPRPSSGPLTMPARPAGGGGCSRCHTRLCCRGWWAGQRRGLGGRVWQGGDSVSLVQGILYFIFIKTPSHLH